MKQTKAWFFSPEPLEEIGEAFVRAGIVDHFDGDEENVYEWLEAETGKGTSVNISRKHGLDELPRNSSQKIREVRLEEPVTVTTGDPGEIETIAVQIAQALQCTVSLGTVIYLGGDEYEFRESHKIHP